MSEKAEKKNVFVGVTLPPDVHKKVMKHLERLRKENPMANQSDAIRDLLTKGAAAA